MSASEFNPMDPELERAVREIRDESIDPAVVEAAAARVWAKLSAHAAEPGSHIRDCSGFQSLIPEYRAGRLPQARATLLKDHLHECVACRRVYEGRVVTMPVAHPAHRSNRNMRWAVAAAVVAAAGLAFWIDLDADGNGRAIVQTVNGALYEISAAGVRPLAAGQDLPDGVEIRTAKDSTAMLALRDGSIVELRERSGFSTSHAASDQTVHLSRGSIIVQAAKRRKGHLYVATADVRVAVTGTVFSVSSGLKGSRVSVIEGEVRVTQNNEEKVLRPGDQTVSSTSLEPLSVPEEIAWSANRDRLIEQMNKLTKGLEQIPLPAARYSSKLLNRLPASVTVYASVPNLAAYLGEAQSVFARNMADSPELRAWWAGRQLSVVSILEKLRTASEYLGEEIAVVALARPGGKMGEPVLVAETRREGFADYLKKQVPLAVELRSGLAVFGPDRKAIDELVAGLDTGAGSSPFYTRIQEAYRGGAGFLFAADMSRNPGPEGARYVIAVQKEVNQQTEVRATVGFEGQRTGMAAWLAEPAPMGSLDYVSPEATLVTAFVVEDAGVIADQLIGVARPLLRGAHEPAGSDVRNDLAKSLGGEFALSVDGPLMPVPSWKLVTEVYDTSRAQATLQKLVDAYNQAAIQKGDKPLRTAQEVVDGRTYYMVAGADPNPLTEAHYTFADGYLIAGPTRALVTRALQAKTNGTSIRHSAQFAALVPRDHYNNFSALVYQNMGKTLAPLTGLIQGLVPGGHGRNALAGFSDMKPALIAAYGEPDRITAAGSGDFFKAGMTNLLSGNLSGMVGSALPLGQLMGTRSR